MYGRNSPGDCLFPFIIGSTYLGVALFIIATAEKVFSWQTLIVCPLAIIVGIAYIYYGARLLSNK